MNNKQLPLIVDFPAQPRIDGSQTRVGTPPASVSFATMSEIAFFEPTSEPTSLFYTSEEMSRFRVRAARDGQCAAMLINLGQVPQDEKDNWIGLERYLSRDVAMRSVYRRRIHAHTVVSWQSRCTVEELCHVSQASSRPAMTLAYRLAAAIVGSEDIQQVLLDITTYTVP